MRGKMLKRVIAGLGLFTFGLVFTFQQNSLTALAAVEDEYVIIVSMGDSYSSGEGLGMDTKLENGGYGSFYGYPEKTEDWYAHRSTVSWPSRLKFSGVTGSLGDYHVELDQTSDALVQWYFIASSGAETIHISTTQQGKPGLKPEELAAGKKYEKCLRLQEDIFKQISEPVDYVTMTIGGNDLGFADIMEAAVKQSLPIVGQHPEVVHAMLDDKEKNLKKYTDDIRKVYVKVNELAQGKATILIAGYPHLVNNNGFPGVMRKELAVDINNKTDKFIEALDGAVSYSRNTLGIDIWFVDVRNAFNGHGAFCWEPYINEIEMKHKDDLPGLISAYSFHPNDKGAQAYADCVNAKIEELEKSGDLSFKVRMASKPSKAVEADVAIYKDDQLITFAPTDENGEFLVKLRAGNYRVEVSADGYMTATATAEIKKGRTTILDTFKLVKASETMTGTIRNAATGNGEKDVKLTIREGADNETGDVLAEAVTDENGTYSVMLAAGDYTVFMEKDGFIPESFNASIKKKQKDPVDAKIRPLSLGDGYTIVLTWGQNPSDLDAHLEGERSDGSKFHVSHKDKNVMDGDKVICTLDEDDMMRNGPEYVTLNVTTKKPYYYYVNRYRGVGKLKDSNAQVKVYQGEKLIETFDVPTDNLEGDYWNVFAVVNGKIEVQNTITEDPDLNYADK
ncbi:MAG: carboxypeptidase regulatory-like domain-containing protein [Acetatifactor sp.]|nr:carboxypeptidase regulatory-like domain-containing protein [Acetatifactor sp.]